MDDMGSGENCKHYVDIVDTETPLNALLCAKYERSFAYFTVNTRLPVILTKVVDSLAREKDLIIQEYGEECKDDLKEIIGLFSKLKHEMQTNKPFIPLTSNAPDTDIWNQYLEEQTRMNGEQCWYSAVFLYTENYMYRRFREMFEQSDTLNQFDPFRNSKEFALLNSMSAVTSFGDYFMAVLENSSMTEKEIKDEFFVLIMIDLWGNSCDLSIFLGEAVKPTDHLRRIEEVRKFVLVDETPKIWSALRGESKSNAGVAIICDNSGYELFTDLCLADFLVTYSLADHITFHLKAIPWYISDVMLHDFHWTLKTLALQSGNLEKLAKRWQGYIDSGKWTLEAAEFWTMPFDFGLMQDKDPELYSRLAREKLAIFKGDLNYRKLVREINWRPTKSFHIVLGSFHPTNIATLRTIKCDTICGLERDQAETCAEKDPLWMRNGDYGVIQFDGVPFDKLTGCTAAAYLRKA